MKTTTGEKLADDALMALETSNQGQIKKAVDYVRFAAPRLMRFTTDDLFEPEEWGFTDPRALGAVMRKSAALGFIRATDTYQKSTRDKCHARPKRVWVSTPRQP